MHLTFNSRSVPCFTNIHAPLSSSYKLQILRNIGSKCIKKCWNFWRIFELFHMKIKIDERILKETISCERYFECLKDDKKNSCAVENFNYEKVLFIKCVANRICSYKRSFGNSFMCACPTRIEIFNKYRIWY